MGVAAMKLRMAELAEKTGVPRTTIHHYLRERLLDQPYKTGRTMAYYDESHVLRLRNIELIKEDIRGSGRSSRVPLDLLKVRIEEEERLTHRKGSKARRRRGGEAERRTRVKETIIKAALKLYEDQGFYQTNVRDIVREARVSPSTFYHYYPDKRELFVDVIEHVIRGFHEELRETLKNEEDLASRSIIMFLSFSENYPRLGVVLNQLRAGAIARDEWARKNLARVYKILSSDLVGELEGLIEKGLARRMDPELLAYFIIAIAEAEIHRTTLDDKYSIAHLAIFAGDLQFNGFLTAKGRKTMGFSGD
jgi:AcrR family transcriptional regulator